GDLSFAYMTRTDRLDPDYNTFPGLPEKGPYPPLTRGLVRGDPYTPVMRAHEGDEVVIKVLVGAHEEEHNFSIHGVKWLSEPANTNSGYRNSWPMGISEFTEMHIGRMPGFDQGRFLDFLYKPTSAAEWQWEGDWGLLRLYRGRDSFGPADPLEALPSNPDGRYGTGTDGSDADNGYRTTDPTRTIPSFNDIAEATPSGTLTSTEGAAGLPIPVACPAGTNLVQYDLTAVAASEVLPNRTLTYNWRTTTVVHLNEPGTPQNPPSNGPLHDPTAILFVETSDLVYPAGGGRPTLHPQAPVEPIILRANAGDCIEVVLRNDLPAAFGPFPTQYADQDGWSGMTPIIEHFNANDVNPSLEVGLHPQLVFFDVRQSDGANVGLNPTQYQKQTVAPGEKIAYYWYAGHVEATDTGIIATPVEFGATGLTSSDPIKHTQKGAVGALIIEPEGSNWTLTDTQNYAG
ncbi:MAG: hypothetical protein KDD47_27890, partial [Acidobacteria bacterium]|nr:hypothetical protein [Acidobacteriota bacterium]